MSESEKSPLQEIEAMRVVADALKDLAPEARGRVLRWAAEACQATGLVTERPHVPEARPSALSTATTERSMSAFASIGDLFAAALPGDSGEAEKALLAAYWFQIVQGNQDFDSQTINTELKHLGRGVSNITQALDTLINRKPQLVIQIRKSGSTQQARKRYKLTVSGQQEVERMIKSGGGTYEAPEK